MKEVLYGVDTVGKNSRKIKEYLRTQIQEDDSLFSFKQTLDSFREKLEILAEERTIVIIVDELDRCLPEYSIKVLERLHHIFYQIKNVVVVLTVAQKQLEKSINQIYGEGINIEKYLKKFIDFNISLDNGDLADDFLQIKYKQFLSTFNGLTNDNISFVDKLSKNMLEFIDIRTQEKLLEKAETIHGLIAKGKKFNISLLCFEIIWVTIAYKCESMDMTWLSNLVIEPNTKIRQIIKQEEMLGGTLVDFLKTIFKDGIKGTVQYTDGKYTALNDSLQAKILWYFSSIYNPIKGKKANGNFYYDGKLSFESETKLANLFHELASFIR